jgi:hypothetical protein
MAETAGRRVHVVSPTGDDAVLLLGWQDPEPVSNGQSPRLSRRRLPVSTIKALVVAHALLQDPVGARTHVTTDQVVRAIDRLTGKSSRTWAVPAVEDTLPQAGLLRPAGPGWALGPTSSGWDDQTREVVSRAVEWLHEHPGWKAAALA